MLGDQRPPVQMVAGDTAACFVVCASGLSSVRAALWWAFPLCMSGGVGMCGDERCHSSGAVHPFAVLSKPDWLDTGPGGLTCLNLPPLTIWLFSYLGLGLKLGSSCLNKHFDQLSPPPMRPNAF